MAPLIDCGAHGFVLPLMQGFVGQKEFELSSSQHANGQDHVQQEGGEV